MTSIIKGGTAFSKGKKDAQITDSKLIEVLSSYKKKIASNYRPIAPENFNDIGHGPFLVSRKIDGEQWFLISRNGEVFLANPRGNALSGNIAILNDAKNLPDGTIIAGELHITIQDGRRERMGDLHSLLSNGKDGSDSDLHFSAFDLVHKDGDLYSGKYEDKLDILKNLISEKSKNLHVIQSNPLKTSEEVKSFYGQITENGHSEGIVVRTSTGLVCKIKPSIEVDLSIVAFTTRINEDNIVRSLLLGVMMDDGTVQVVGGCGNLGSESDRKTLFDICNKNIITSDIRYASETGALYSFIKPSVVVQVKVTDFQSEHTDGTTIQQPLLKLDSDNWASIGTSACPKLIHPTIELIRKDKKPTPSEAGFSQISSYLSESPSLTKENKNLPKSEVIQRKVWTKDNKGQVAIRKLVVWKTNKESINPHFPAFVVHWTDYSPGRASPLDRDVTLAPTKELAEKIASTLIEENIKKGWVEYV